MIKQILMNEVRDVLGRNPTEEEFKGFVDYIVEYFNDQVRAGKADKVFTADVGLLLYEYRNDNYRQCEDCGEWYLIGSDDWNWDGCYCVNCKPNQDPDMMPGGHDYY